MKQQILIGFVFLFILGCNSTGNNKIEEDRANIESIENKIKIENGVEEFGDFMNFFVSDSIFQMSRIKFPITGTYCDFDTTMVWTKDNWDCIIKKVSEIDTTQYNVKLTRNGDEYFEEITCKECGFAFSMKFQLVNKNGF